LVSVNRYVGVKKAEIEPSGLVIRAGRYSNPKELTAEMDLDAMERKLRPELDTEFDPLTHVVRRGRGREG
jgi:hypothetical protein